MFKPLYQPPCILKKSYGKGMLWRQNTNEKKVWLTFDDGPFPPVTNKIVQTLQSFNVRATFFMVAQNAELYHDLYLDVLEAGHAVGNHTFSHINGWKTSTNQYIQNIQRAAKILNFTHLFRPPYGKLKCKQKNYLLQNGYTICMWDVLTHDYDRQYQYTDIIKIVTSYTRNGSIINFHDSQKAGANVIKALPYCIEFLLHEGYSLQIL